MGIYQVIKRLLGIARERGNSNNNNSNNCNYNYNCSINWSM